MDKKKNKVLYEEPKQEEEILEGVPEGVEEEWPRVSHPLLEKPKKKKAKKEPEKEVELEVEKEPEHYTLGKIGSFIQYNCKYCAFDTLLSEEAIMEHVNASHIVGGKIRLRGVKYDSFGNEIK